MRILLTALLATMFLTGCPDDKKDSAKDKDTKSDTAAPKDSAKKDSAKKDKGDKKDEEGGW
jgi:PBP1b-binding outer membrane lipoprotein LpoB